MTNSGSDPPRDGSDRPPTEESTSSSVETDDRSTSIGGGDSNVRAPDERRSTPDDSAPSIESDGVIRWFMRTEETPYVYVRDVVSSVGLVLLIALVLFGVSGVWPPLVAVESGSMEPHMERGDMIFVVDEDRFVGDGYIDGTGIVTYETGAESGYTSFGNPGDVIIFRPDGSEVSTPVIHRAHFWVEAEENWVESKADPLLTGGRTCSQITTCPAPHAGFITYGDANSGYDQLTNSGAETTVVKPEWVEGKAKYRVPWLGHIRLTVDETFATLGLGDSPSSGATAIAEPFALAQLLAPPGLLLTGVLLTRRE